MKSTHIHELIRYHRSGEMKTMSGLKTELCIYQSEAQKRIEKAVAILIHHTWLRECVSVREKYWRMSVQGFLKNIDPPAVFLCENSLVPFRWNSSWPWPWSCPTSGQIYHLKLCNVEHVLTLRHLSVFECDLSDCFDIKKLNSVTLSIDYDPVRI